MADGDAVEKLVQDSNFNHVKESSNLSEARVANSLNFLTLNMSNSDLKIATVTDDPILNVSDYTAGNIRSIIWSNPQVFVKPVHISKFHSGKKFHQSSTHFSKLSQLRYSYNCKMKL